jgi:D-alanyl-D-alanine dipeptidase
MQRCLWNVGLAGLIALSAAAPAPAQKVVRKGKNLVEVTVLGQGVDKDEALRDALRKAVERGAGTFLYSHSETEDFALVRDTILARSAGFVQSHKILSQKQAEDGAWELKVAAVVSVQGIEDTWGVVTNLLKQMGRPKVMVHVRERIRSQPVALSTVQTRIENVLLKSGFKLVDRKQLKAIDAKDLDAALTADNMAKVQAIAKRFGAQLFITGTADASPGVIKRIGGVLFYTYEAECNVRCYRSDTAEMMSAIPGSPTRGVQRVWRSAAKQALDLQAKRVAPRVRLDVLRFWQGALAGRGEVKLVVEGVSFKQYMEIKRALKTIKQVKDVTTKYHNRQADCSIESSLRAETLAEKIAETLEGLEITDVSQNVIKAKLAQGS